MPLQNTHPEKNSIAPKLPSFMKEEMQSSGLTLQPSAVMADFVLADFVFTIQTVELQFPSTTIMGCYFHFSQCIWHKVQALGLATTYSSDRCYSQALHPQDCCTFIRPSNLLEGGLVRYQSKLPKHTRHFRLHRLLWVYLDMWKGSLLGYVEGELYFHIIVTNIHSLCSLSYSFPPRMWNHFQNSSPRTNNHLEGWHYRLNRLARKAHPNLFETIELIKNEQASKEVQMIQLAAGGQPRPKNKNKSC